MSISCLACTDGGPVDIGDSMWSIYQGGIDKDPRHMALIVEFQPPDHLEHLVGRSPGSSHCLQWSYEQLRRGSIKLAASFRAHGVLPGATIAALISNSAEWALLTWAAAVGQYSIALLDFRSTEAPRVEELKYFLKTLKPAVIVVDETIGTEYIDRLSKDLTLHIQLRICRCPIPSSAPGWLAFEQLGQQNDNEVLLPVKDSPERIATYMFTSGTSVGHPKGVPRTVENWLSCAATSCMQPVTQDTIASLTTLCFRIACNTLGIAVWSSGGTLIIPSPELDGEKLVDVIQRYNVNYIQPVFQQLFPIVENPSFTIDKVRSIKRIHMGGDVITTQQLAQRKEYFPDCSFSNYYGMTEGTGVTGWPGNLIPEPLPVLENIVSPGRAGPGSKLRIVGGNGHIVRRNESGELHMGGLVIATEYLDNLQPENFYSDEEGKWIKTGDTALIDGDGNLFVLGRTKDIIKRKGVPISPSSIESCLREYGEVVAQLIGIESQKYGEEAYAIVADRIDSSSVERLKAVVVAAFGSEYALSGIVPLENLGMNNWPKNSADKVLKKDLKNALIRYLSNQQQDRAIPKA